MFWPKDEPWEEGSRHLLSGWRDHPDLMVGIAPFLTFPVF